MVTKAQLLRVLEPFESDTEIQIIIKSYGYEPRVFYTIDQDGNGQIFLTNEEPKHVRKVVELKI